MESCRAKEIVRVQSKTPARWTTATIVTSIMRVILFVAAGMAGLVGLAGTAFCGYNILRSKKDIDGRLKEIGQRYSKETAKGRQTIEECVSQWKDARSVVDQFAGAPVKTLVA